MNNEKKETCLIVLGFLFATPILIAYAVIGFDALKLFIANLGDIIYFLFIAALVIGGGALLAKIPDTFRSGSRSSSFSRRPSEEYPENWNDLRNQILDRDKHCCGNCGATIELHVHHIVPLSKGGTNNPNNLRTLCKTCHEKLHPHMRR